MTHTNRTQSGGIEWQGLENLEARLLLSSVSGASVKPFAAVNTPPIISNLIPSPNATSVGLAPHLQADFDDGNGDLMNITFQFYNTATGAWQVVKSLVGVPSGVYEVSVASLVNSDNTTYQWKVSAVDPAGSGQVIEKSQSFTTENPIATDPLLTLKWTQQLTMSDADFRERQLNPVMGDIDNDGTQEIVLTAGENLYVLNGKTGEIKWTIQGEARETACELCDLDNDGIPEILYGLLGTRLRAVNGDGTIRWTTGKLRGVDQCMFPILTADIDGDGLPSIYFFTEDQDPSPYSGNLNDYSGAVNMLDNTGKLLRTTWLYHPCWGGASLADCNGDGKYELFVSDRREGYDGVPAHGLAAYDAATLKTLWTRPDIHHSSPIPILVDVTGDGKLDLVAQRIVDMGPIIIDPMTGKTIKDYSNRGLPTHGTATVYDIDGDGHQEIIMATSYPLETTPTIFTVFDLVTGKKEFEPTLEVHATWPPRVGDVTGDGKMEILAALGNQNDRTGTNALLIYDSKYRLLQRVELAGSGQLSPAKVFDTDSDGLNEVVLVGKSGKIAVYDTPAPTPNPAPRTWVQMYSEQRTNVPLYIAPPGANTLSPAPQLNGPLPGDGLSSIPLNPTLSIRVRDYQNQLFTLTFEVALAGSNDWHTVRTYTKVPNGTYTASTGTLVNMPSMDYQWRVTAVDSDGHSTQETYSFTTAVPANGWFDGWTYRRRITITNMTTGLAGFPTLVEVTLSSLASGAQSDGDDILFTSADGVTRLDHEIESYDPVTGHLVAWVETPAVPASGTGQLYIYYGNAQVGSQQNPAAVWSSYPGVQYQGVGSSMSLPQAFNDEHAFTIEAITSGNQQKYIFSQRITGTSSVLLQYYAPSQKYQFLMGSSKLVATTSPNLWCDITAGYDGTTASLYVNGLRVASMAASLTWPDQDTEVGDGPSLSNPFMGRLDDVRLSDTPHNCEYIRAVFNNRYNLSSLLTVGVTEIKI